MPVSNNLIIDKKDITTIEIVDNKSNRYCFIVKFIIR
jgi:hypothetical protein